MVPPAQQHNGHATLRSLGSAMSTTVHCCLVYCVDDSEGRWKEVRGVWLGEAASAKPMGGKPI